MIEYLDAFDADGRHLGAMPRTVVHQKGLWHNVFHCLVVADRSGVPHVVLQRRSPDKASFPGLLDLTATGHLAAGESVADGVRELAEEVGLQVPFTALRPLGLRRIVDGGLLSEGLNREIVHLFLLREDRPVGQYVPAPGEVAAVIETAARDVLELFLGSRQEIPARGTDGTERVTRADFVPDVDGYWPDLMRAVLVSCAAGGGSAPPG